MLYFPKEYHLRGQHSFAKPVALLEYLIRTYSNENAVVLDPTMGSGSAGVACLATGRQFIGAENGKNKKGECIFTIAKERIEESGKALTTANDDAKPTKPRRKLKPMVKPSRPLKPVILPDDVPPLPSIIPAF